MTGLIKINSESIVTQNGRLQGPSNEEWRRVWESGGAIGGACSIDTMGKWCLDNELYELYITYDILVPLHSILPYLHLTVAQKKWEF